MSVLNQAPTELKLPSIIGSNMVIQAGARAPIWGKSAPGRSISVTFRGDTKKTTTNAAGEWQVAFRNLTAGRGGAMQITDGVSSVTLENVLVGDVWVASGQSNMEWPLALTDNAEKETAAARFETIRLFTVVKRAAAGWTGDVEGEWVVCTPEAAREFSAVAYFFGRSLALSESRPIGLIDTTWGGTPAEAWTPKDALLAHPLTRSLWTTYERGWDQVRRNDPELMELIGRPGNQVVEDPGNKGEPQGWAKPGAPLGDWKDGVMPAPFENLPNMNINGVVWFRKTFQVKPQDAGKPAKLSLGPIDDFDITYLNGEKAGETTAATPNHWSHPRQYEIPAGKIKAGENTIAVRIHDSGGQGGFTGQPADMVIQVGDAKIPLSGDWKYRVEFSVRAIPPGLTAPNNPNSPTALWDAMVRPLVPFGIKGAIWYQGESNVGRAEQYGVLFPNMIRAWRTAWAQGDFPFLFVQLANFQARQPEPGESGWAELRESQEMALNLPNAGSAVIIDIGDANDIHPRNKKDVGERLATSARRIAYKGSEPAGDSPRFQRWVLRGKDAVVSFRDARGLATTDGGAPVGFAVRGETGGWVWATARIEGETVIVSHPRGEVVQGVRYGWADNPVVNLVNGLGLPVCPFRTDRPAWFRSPGR